MPIVIVRPPRPHPAQATVTAAARRYNVLACGRRWGKSTLGIDRLIEPALRGLPVAWCSPTYRMLLDAWEATVSVLTPMIAHRSEQEHRLLLRSRGRVDFWSLEDPDTIRGGAYARIVIDEAAQMGQLERAWERVLRPALTDYQGDAWFLSTPRGMNYFHRLFARGRDEAESEWAAWGDGEHPTQENPYIPREDVEAAQRELPANIFAQEYEGRFISEVGAIFNRAHFRYYTKGEGYYILEAEAGPRAVAELAAPEIASQPARLVPAPPADRIMFRFVTVDLAASQKTAADYFAAAVWGVTARKELVWHDLVRRRLEGPDQIPVLWALLRQWRAAFVLVEANGYQLALVQQAVRDGMPVRPVRADKDKVARALAMSTRMATGTVFFPHEAAWLGTAQDELLAFPPAPGGHDDIVDVCSMAAQELTRHAAGPEQLAAAAKAYAW